MTEPKRIIGGVHTQIEFQCGLYIDPPSGDIYAVNNDSVNKLVVFSRQAKGDVPPDRELETPHGTFGIVVDERRQEMFLTIQHDSAVVVYPKLARGKDAPLRYLQGDRTLLADPHGIALDTKNDLIFVANIGSAHQVRPGASAAGEAAGASQAIANWPLSWDNAVPGSGKMTPPSITVYPRAASGDTAPVRVIQGPKTQLDWPSGVAVDEDRGELYVANDMADSIVVFSTSANGDVAPLRVLKGPKTLIKNPTGVFVDKKNGELWVASFGNHVATVFKPTASGDTPPLRVIRSSPLGHPALGIGNPHPVAYDTKREEILVPN
jgi:DNA-binding beta-propeller fold protein YncE